jgi:hypothetical protein
LSDHHDAQLAYGALAMAVAVRGGQVPGVILHTDQGSEYIARAFRQACERLSVRQSMGRPGRAIAVSGRPSAIGSSTLRWARGNWSWPGAGRHCARVSHCR